MNLCFDNAMLYNPKTSDVHALARDLKKDLTIFTSGILLWWSVTQPCEKCGRQLPDMRRVLHQLNSRILQRSLRWPASVVTPGIIIVPRMTSIGASRALTSSRTASPSSCLRPHLQARLGQ